MVVSERFVSLKPGVSTRKTFRSPLSKQYSPNVDVAVYYVNIGHELRESTC